MSSIVSDDERSTLRLGALAAGAAYVIWGFLPVYLKAVGYADPREVLAQRILWSAPSAAVGVALMGGLGAGWAGTRAALTPKLLGLLALSSLFIFGNWAIYVWAVAHERVMEASLAYFLAPLVQVAAGVGFFGERLSRSQMAALLLAAFGVVVQGVAIGAPPWTSLALCATWCAYAIVRKQAPVPAAVGLAVETVVLAIPAVGLLVWTAHDHPLAFGGGAAHAALLALAGPATALPLILFAFGARRIPFATLGLLQYAAPSIQFLLGVLYGEPLTPLRAASFALIWLGLVVFSANALRRPRFAQRQA
jgi:chloramphenicol-sensitive protein RarD